MAETFEFIRANLINTTTQIIVNSNTATAGYIMIPDQRFQYASASMADDTTVTTMRITFAQTTTIDRIAICNHNLKKFSLFYNALTANTFALTSTSDTTTANYLNNSNTHQFFRFAPVDVTSVSLDMYSTIVANSNKAVGYMVIGDKLTDFAGRRPAAQNYRINLVPKQIMHELASGGVRVQTISDNWRAQLGFDFLSTTIQQELKDIYDNHDELVFCPFGTCTGWDGLIFPAVWSGEFPFYNYSDNSSEAGFSGTIELVGSAK